MKAHADLLATVQAHAAAVKAAASVAAGPDPAVAAGRATIEANYTQLRVLRKRIETSDGT